MKLKLDNPQAILNSLKELETAYSEYEKTKPVLSHTAAYIEQQLDAIADMKKDVADELNGGTK